MVRGRPAHKPFDAYGNTPIDIRAFEDCGGTGTLASMKVVSEAPSPGAKLFTRRSQVPWPPEGHRDIVRPACPGAAGQGAGESWPRYLNEDSRPFEPRFCFHFCAFIQPVFRALALS